MRLVVALCLVFMMSACAETALIRSEPPGARVWVNGQDVGKTPVHLRIPRGELGNLHAYRVELDGYESAQGQITLRPVAGRIVGGIFTAGILLAFKPIRVPRNVDVVLQRVGSSKTDSADPTTRLLRLKTLLNDGMITPEEYQRRRDAIVNDL